MPADKGVKSSTNKTSLTFTSPLGRIDRPKRTPKRPKSKIGSPLVSLAEGDWLKARLRATVYPPCMLPCASPNRSLTIAHYARQTCLY